MTTARKQKPTETDPVLAEPTVITINEREYTLRKLGVRDVFRVSRILGRGIGVLANDGANLTGGQVVQVLVASLSQNEEEVLALVADVLGVSRKQLEDPNVFPMESIIDVFEALAEHQDLRAFLARVQSLVERLPEAQSRMRTT